MHALSLWVTSVAATHRKSVRLPGVFAVSSGGFGFGVVQNFVNVSPPVTVTIGGQPAASLYSGRTPSCSEVDQTVAIAAAGATRCKDAGNPLSKLVQSGGSQAIIAMERVDSIENINSTTPVLKIRRGSDAFSGY